VARCVFAGFAAFPVAPLSAWTEPAGALHGPPLGIGGASAGQHTRDGQAREDAVTPVVASPSPGLARYWVLRTTDWVRPAQDRARACLGTALGHPRRRLHTAVLTAPSSSLERLGEFGFIGPVHRNDHR